MGERLHIISSIKGEVDPKILTDADTNTKRG